MLSLSRHESLELLHIARKPGKVPRNAFLEQSLCPSDSTVHRACRGAGFSEH